MLTCPRVFFQCFFVFPVKGTIYFANFFNHQVKGPSGNQIQDYRDKTSEKFEFMAHEKGLHRFCFTNKSPYHETIDFDVYTGHFAYYDQHAKDGEWCFSVLYLAVPCLALEKYWRLTSYNCCAYPQSILILY